MSHFTLIGPEGVSLKPNQSHVNLGDASETLARQQCLSVGAPDKQPKTKRVSSQHQHCETYSQGILGGTKLK